MRTQISNHIETRMSEVSRMTGESGGKDGGSHGGKGAGLNNPKDTVMSKLGESPSKADFLLWRRNLELHLEISRTLARASR